MSLLNNGQNLESWSGIMWDSVSHWGMFERNEHKRDGFLLDKKSSFINFYNNPVSVENSFVSMFGVVSCGSN